MATMYPVHRQDFARKIPVGEENAPNFHHFRSSDPVDAMARPRRRLHVDRLQTASIIFIDERRRVVISRVFSGE